MISDDYLLHNIRSSFHRIACRQISSMLDSAFGIRVEDKNVRMAMRRFDPAGSASASCTFEPVLQTVFCTSSVILLTLSKIVAGISRYLFFFFGLDRLPYRTTMVLD